MVRVEVLEQLVAREDAAGRRSERAQQAEFHRRQVELAAVERSAVALLVERQAAGERHAAAAQDRLDARDALAGTEGLADVVVGAKGETDQAVDFLDPGGDHYDRNGAERAQLAADLQAVAPGEHLVEQDKVRRMLADPLDHLQAVRDAMRFKTLGAKVI